MHHLRGSNNKLNEANNGRNNANRLFNSQNNGDGGYQVGDDCYDPTQPCSDPNTNSYIYDAPGAGQGKMYFYQDSYLYLEWTSQHGCGLDNKNTHCDIIIQYMCDENLRDGGSTTTITDDPDDSQDTIYGMHENYDYYQSCKNRERNKGLFTADRNLGDKATSTRQNNNGQRFGFECPEERDYYPYWHPTPWRDIVILTDDLLRCDFYKSESQNVRNKGSCQKNSTYNQPQTCYSNGGSWVESSSWKTSPPECSPAPWTRDNHLGNGISGQPASYSWKIPRDIESENCALRIRYNISTDDYVSWGVNSLDAGSNKDRSPIKNNPVKDFLNMGTGVSGPLRLALDTSQFGRTFEDRSHTFAIRKKPSSLLPTDQIHNLNVRGRRGNINNVYPSVEYDFVPNTLSVHQGDFIHIQWTGSDANNAGNAGNGRAMTDRSNIVQIKDLGVNVPLPIEKMTMFSNVNGDVDRNLVQYLAFLNQSYCNETTTDQNDIYNCAVLNSASSYFDAGLIKMKNPGTYHYMSTRNNAYSNRSQKGTLIVVGLAGWIVGLISVGSAIVVAGAVTGAIAITTLYAASHPASYIAKSFLGKVLVKSFAKRLCCCAPAVVALPTLDDDEEEDKPGLIRRYWRRNKSKIVFLILYALINVFLFFYGFINNMGKNFPYYSCAKSGGTILDFNCALILVPVMRNMISLLRLTPLSRLLPLDFNIFFHKMVFCVITGASIIHIVSHMFNYYYMRSRTGISVAVQVFGSRAGMTGVVILITMAIMASTASEKIRRKTFSIRGRKLGGYNIFWYVHKLYYVALGVLLIHAPTWWIWFLWPFLLFFLEKLLSYTRNEEPTKIVRVSLEGSDVMRIEMYKKNFRYRPGQYLYLSCPALSKEVHPFTITSAPEEQFFSVHIRCRGDWTSDLKKYLNPDNCPEINYNQHLAEELITTRSASDEADIPLTRKDDMPLESPKSSSSNTETQAPKKKKPRKHSKRAVSPELPSEPPVPESPKKTPIAFSPPAISKIPRFVPKITTDGPYGSATEHVFDYNVLMLVGAGIGVTPFASVMKSIRLRTASSCKNCGSSTRHVHTGVPKKVYFYWICGNEQEFNWFKPLLKDIEEDNSLMDMFELNTYMTGELNLEEMVKKLGSGQSNLNMKYAGRPNWNRIFKEKKESHPSEEIGVFLCGPDTIAKELEINSLAHSSFTHGMTKFTFRKENF